MHDDNSPTRVYKLQEIAMNIINKKWSEDPKKAEAMVECWESENASRPCPRSSTATVSHQQGVPEGRVTKRRGSRKKAKPVAGALSASVVEKHKCPECSEIENPGFPMGTIGSDREHDAKRHLKRYHHKNSLWQCPEAGCGHFFEWRQAFEAHLKKDHDLKNVKKDKRYEDDKVTVPLCRQVAFACGYFGCKYVSVALDPAQVEMKIEDYYNHIKDHHKKGIPQQGWSRATRFRNLLRQSEIMNRAWKQMAKDSLVRCQPHDSLVLRKMLETSHILDGELFVRYALGLSPGRDGLSVTFCLPTKGSCGIDHEHLNSAALLGAKDTVAINAYQVVPVANPTELEGPFGNYSSSTHADAPSAYALQQRSEASSYQAYSSSEMFMEMQGNNLIATIDPQIYYNQNIGLSSVIDSHSAVPLYGTYRPSTPYSSIAPSHQTFGHGNHNHDLI